jgi:putative addiction module component (TIGR02574 family)
MNQRVKQICEEIRRLAPDEQAELLAEISDVVAPVDAAAIDQSWIEEAERRLYQIDSGEVTPIPANRAMQQLRSRYPRQS